MNNDPIWIIDDDLEDQELIRDIFRDLKLTNPMEFFKAAEAMLERLEEADNAPFIIIADVNLPGIDGFELREKMLQTPNNKFHSVPFIFWSTYVSEAQIQKAFSLNAHGFFIKEPKYQDWKTSLIRIVEYWQKSLMPSKKDEPDDPVPYKK